MILCHPVACSQGHDQRTVRRQLQTRSTISAGLSTWIWMPMLCAVRNHWRGERAGCWKYCARREDGECWCGHEREGDSDVGGDPQNPRRKGRGWCSCRRAGGSAVMRCMWQRRKDERKKVAGQCEAGGRAATEEEEVEGGGGCWRGNKSGL